MRDNRFLVHARLVLNATVHAEALGTCDRHGHLYVICEGCKLVRLLRAVGTGLIESWAAGKQEFFMRFVLRTSVAGACSTRDAANRLLEPQR